MDPFRLPAARAFQQPFDPPKRFERSDPYDNQNGEAEYRDRGLLRRDFIERCALLDWQAVAYDNCCRADEPFAPRHRFERGTNARVRSTGFVPGVTPYEEG